MASFDSVALPTGFRGAARESVHIRLDSQLGYIRLDATGVHADQGLVYSLDDDAVGLRKALRMIATRPA